MTTFEQSKDVRQSPYLRIYYGEESEHDSDGFLPVSDQGGDRLSKAEIAAYWSGRNRAARISARIAA